MVKIKNLFKRTISMFILTAVIFTAIPQSYIAYADNLSGDNDGGNTSGTGTGGTGSAWSTWRGNGYRFYLVDANFNQITGSIDFVNGISEMNSLDNSNRLKGLYNTRFSSAEFTHITYNINDLPSWCDTSADMNKYIPVTATAGTQGKDFIEWFQGDWSGSVGTGNRNSQHAPSNSTRGSSSSKGISNTRPGPATNTVSIEQNNGRTILGTGKAVYGRLANKASTGSIYLASARAAARGLQSAFNRSWALNINKYSGSEMDALYYTLDYYYRNRVNASINKNDLLSEDDYKKLVIYYLYSNADSEVMFNNSNLLNTNIPLASGAGEDSPAVHFLKKEATKNQWQSSLSSLGYDSPIDAIKNGDCKLIVEPVTAVNIKGTNKYLYGSCWNITKYLTSHNLKTSADLSIRQRYFVTIYVDQNWTVNGAL